MLLFIGNSNILIQDNIKSDNRFTVPSKFIKIISFIIISEFLLTALGFCGHCHDESPEEHTQIVHHSHSPTGEHLHISDHSVHEHSHDHECDCHQHDDNQKDKHRCSCQGGFIGEVQPAIFYIILKSDSFTTLELPKYEQSWVPFVYHPPKRSN